MKTTTCLLVFASILGVYSAQVALLPVEGVYAAPMDYEQMGAPIATRDDTVNLEARSPIFKALRSIFKPNRKSAEITVPSGEQSPPAKRDEDDERLA